MCVSDSLLAYMDKVERSNWAERDISSSTVSANCYSSQPGGSSKRSRHKGVGELKENVALILQQHSSTTVTVAITGSKN